MLCLSRKIGQDITIGNVTIRVTAILGDKVRIAIDAPKDVQISRPDAKKAAA